MTTEEAWPKAAGNIEPDQTNGIPKVVKIRSVKTSQLHILGKNAIFPINIPNRI